MCHHVTEREMNMVVEFENELGVKSPSLIGKTNL